MRPNRQTDGSTDIWKFTPMSYRTSAFWGRCLKRKEEGGNGRKENSKKRKKEGRKKEGRKKVGGKRGGKGGKEGTEKQEQGSEVGKGVGRKWS